MKIEEFQLDTTIHGDGGAMYLSIEMLGALGSWIGEMHYPISWRDVDDDGNVRSDVMQQVTGIVAKLNASNAPMMPHPATTDGLIPITTPEALSIEEEVARDYQEQMAWQEEVEEDGLYIYE